MNDVVVIPSRQGPLIIDFAEKNITWERGGISANAIGLLPFTINFSDVTAIELRKPSFFKLGCCNVIIKNKRYTTPNSYDITTVNVEKANFEKMAESLQRVLDFCGIASFSEVNSVNAPKVVFVNAIHEFETRKKCNQCEHIFCFSPLDIARNKSLAKQAKYSRMAQLGNVMGGTNLGAAVNQMNAANSANQIVDYNVCPVCHSRDLSIISKEEYEAIAKAKKANSTPAPAAVPTSSAEELKKFKELLDSGIITQEEFDAKKKQLLGL